MVLTICQIESAPSLSLSLMATIYGIFIVRTMRSYETIQFNFPLFADRMTMRNASNEFTGDGANKCFAWVRNARKNSQDKILRTECRWAFFSRAPFLCSFQTQFEFKSAVRCENIQSLISSRISAQYKIENGDPSSLLYIKNDLNRWMMRKRERRKRQWEDLAVSQRSLDAWPWTMERRRRQWSRLHCCIGARAADQLRCAAANAF